MEKSNKLTILNTKDYIEKMETFNKEMKYIELKKDPTTNIHRRTRDLIKNRKWLEGVKNKIKNNKTQLIKIIKQQPSLG